MDRAFLERGRIGLGRGLDHTLLLCADQFEGEVVVGLRAAAEAEETLGLGAEQRPLLAQTGQIGRKAEKRVGEGRLVAERAERSEAEQFDDLGTDWGKASKLARLSMTSPVAISLKTASSSRWPKKRTLPAACSAAKASRRAFSVGPLPMTESVPVPPRARNDFQITGRSSDRFCTWSRREQ